MPNLLVMHLPRVNRHIALYFYISTVAYIGCDKLKNLGEKHPRIRF